MGMYIPAFGRNEVTGQYLTQIDKHDLRSLGMKSIGMGEQHAHNQATYLNLMNRTQKEVRATIEDVA